jgi:hypothetical protein
LQPEKTNLGVGGNARPITERTYTMKHDLIELTEDEFDTRYPLRTNHLNPHASWAFADARGCLFETFGEEFEFVRKQHPSTVWTLVDGEDGDMYLHSRMHFVNRIGYLVSLAAVPEGVDIQIHIPMQHEEVEDIEPTSGRRPA